MRWPLIEIGAGITLAFAVLIWPDPLPVIKWGGLGLGLALIALGMSSGLRGKSKSVLPRWQPMWSVRIVRRDRLPFRRIVPLGDAARTAYEQTQGTMMAKVAERLSKQDVLGYFLHALTGLEGVQIFGTRPHSTKLEPITSDSFNSGSFTDGGSTFKLYGQDQPRYTNLAIKKSDVRRFVRKTKTNDKADWSNVPD